MLGGIAIAVILCWVAAFFVLRSFHDAETQRMVAAANRIDVPGDWALTSERVESEKLVCLNANQCPSLQRTWQATEQLDEDGLRSIAESAGLKLTLDRPCVRQENVFGSTAVCTASGSIDSYQAFLTINSPEPDAHSVVVLRVEPPVD